jgi:hypothetical protein
MSRTGDNGRPPTQTLEAVGTATADEVLAASEGLAGQGRYREAIDLLVEANRALASTEVYQRLVELRHESYLATDHPAGTAAWPPAGEDRFAGVTGIPEIQAHELSAAAIAAGLLHHGCLIVRGLVPPDRAGRLVEGIDRAFDALDTATASNFTVDTAPWFSPFVPKDGNEYTHLERAWTRSIGGVLAADSPRMMYEVIDALQAVDMGRHLDEYLGEWPALSVKKFTLRRAPADAPSEWHQDGSFLGTAIRTVNVWMALSPCGVDAPGLEIIPRRFDELVERGTGTALFDWSVGTAAADRVAEGRTACPVFAPGDVALFDQMTLHRTSVTPEMTKPRYCVESWFFAPSTYPLDQVPVTF